MPAYAERLSELSDESRNLSSAAQSRLGIPSAERLVGGGAGMGDPRELLNQLASGQIGAEQLIALLALLTGLPGLGGGGPAAMQGPGLAAGGAAPGGDLGPIGEAMLG